MKAIDRLEQLLSFISGASLSVLAAGVFLQVVMRYVFSYTPFWSEEAFRILLVWCVMAGAAVSVRDNQHIRVDFIVETLPPGARRVIYSLIDVATLVFFVAVVVAGYDAVTFNHSMRTVALQWPMSYLIVAVPLGFAAAAVFLLVRMRARRQARRLA